MGALQRKTWRDLVHIRGQALAIALVMACGIATFVMSLTALASLESALDTYYARRRFADVFAHLERAPRSLATRIGEVPGVRTIEARIVESVLLDIPDMTEPAVGRLISLPDDGRPALNDVHLQSGRWPEATGAREVLVNTTFASAHEMVPGDTITAVLNGRRDDLLVVGIALSPEFIYQIREGELLPDDKRFGIFWMRERELAAAFDMEGAFNDVALGLMPGASLPDVIDRVDGLTASYGGLGAYGREDQASNFYLTKEIEELRNNATIIPSVFLAVAAFLLHVVVGRLVATQRTEIAALRALGYTRVQVARHYLGLVLVLALSGGAAGVVLGAWMGAAMTRMYDQFFHFPSFDYVFQPRAAVLALLIAGVAAVAGTAGVVVRAAARPPAEAMRPAPPATYRRTLIERLGLGRRLTPALRMILRQLERRPAKAALSIAAIAMSVAIIVLGESMSDMLDRMIEHEFSERQRYDVQVAFIHPRGPEAMAELRSLPGVLRVEPQRMVPCRLRAEHRSRRTALRGHPEGATLIRLLDRDDREHTLPMEGCMLSRMLADELDVAAGDDVRVEVMEAERPIVTLQVDDIIDDMTGMAAYARLDVVNRLVGDEREANIALLLVDPGRLDALYAALKERPGVGAVSIKRAALESFESTLAELMLLMRAFNVSFAIVIAVGVVYNTVRISLSERSRDLATLRVIGFTRGEISFILLGELAVLAAIAIPAGLALGWWLTRGLTAALETEVFRLPFVVDRSTLALAAGIVTMASVLSGLVVRRLLDRLDLVAVLKTRE